MLLSAAYLLDLHISKCKKAFLSRFIINWFRSPNLHVFFNIIQLSTGFGYNSSFVWPEDESVARSRGLRATDPIEDQLNCCCSRSQSKIAFYTLIFSKFSYSFFPGKLLRKRITASWCCVGTQYIIIKEIVKVRCIKVSHFVYDTNL